MKDRRFLERHVPASTMTSGASYVTFVPRVLPPVWRNSLHARACLVHRCPGHLPALRDDRRSRRQYFRFPCDSPGESNSRVITETGSETRLNKNRSVDCLLSNSSSTAALGRKYRGQRDRLIGFSEVGRPSGTRFLTDEKRPMPDCRGPGNQAKRASSCMASRVFRDMQMVLCESVTRPRPGSSPSQAQP